MNNFKEAKRILKERKNGTFRRKLGRFANTAFVQGLYVGGKSISEISRMLGWPEKEVNEYVHEDILVTIEGF